ncbi:hypothetical protein NZ698_04515 [Chryseobacterium sp. PBS4-4]|uniref:DUF86 domain-containing protein n=1 Tax=Chryseobacterium edaphi TaxID=2976532 RepID=A0ABT2W2J6_9FLAO|nr:hypothetical protein [Chryseobacterium edaphi]MCU7616451.1 hypothetical protein [Chryseobacterium edaphi]
MTIDQIRKSALNWDEKISRLEIIIEGVNKAIKNLFHNELSSDWWGTMDERQECEAIYRLAILAFENYIYSTIRIYFKEKDYSKFYEFEPNVDLIIKLAKHITSGENTDQEALKKFNLTTNDYPIYNGINLLNADKNLDEIVEILKRWRTKLIHIIYPISDSL